MKEILYVVGVIVLAILVKEIRGEAEIDRIQKEIAAINAANEASMAGEANGM